MSGPDGARRSGAAQGVTGGTGDAKTQTLGRIKTLVEGLDPAKYYYRIGGERVNITPESTRTMLEKLGNGRDTVHVVRDEGKGNGHGTLSYRRMTGDPRAAENSPNMFKQADNGQLVDFENQLKKHIANPTGSWVR